MDYIPLTLEEYINQFPEGPLRDEKISDTAVQMVEAVQQLHSLGTIHRDIKPSNFLVSENGFVKLTDFGTVFEYINEDTKSHI
jgi:serine/threonine protein kinase